MKTRAQKKIQHVQVGSTLVLQILVQSLSEIVHRMKKKIGFFMPTLNLLINPRENIVL